MANTESPFQTPRNRLNFGLDWGLLVMLVAATTAALLGYAMFMPAVTSEVNAWFGRTVDVGDVEKNRQAQIVFLVACYAAPLVMSVVARLVYLGGQILTRTPKIDKSEEEFRME